MDACGNIARIRFLAYIHSDALNTATAPNKAKQRSRLQRAFVIVVHLQKEPRKIEEKSKKKGLDASLEI